MRTVSIHEAKTHLYRLVDQAARGESFVIAKAGKPLVKVTRLEPTEVKQRIGFMAGEFTVADDFDIMEALRSNGFSRAGIEAAARHAGAAVGGAGVAAPAQRSQGHARG